jgi:hypothetical protein
MARVEIKSLDGPDEVRGRTRLVTLSGGRIGLAVFELCRRLQGSRRSGPRRRMGVMSCSPRRYVLRPPFAQERLRLRDDGRVRRRSEEAVARRHAPPRVRAARVSPTTPRS